MGSCVSELQETLSYPYRIKVHLDMCNQIQSMVNRISSILPDIEAARPQCSLGIQALCQLRNAMELAKILVHNCCESSKLYLALTGRKVVSRFEQTRNLLQKSLSQLQNMVPMVLQSKISEILVDLRAAIFFMDSHEEQAGKALRALLHQDKMNPVGTSDVELLRFAALKLHLSSQKDLLIERKSIRKLLNKVQDGNSTKREALNCLLNLLESYNKLIVRRHTKNPITKNNGSHLDRPQEFKSMEHMIVVSDTEITASTFASFDTSSKSIFSTTSAITDICLQIDMSNISFGSLDNCDSFEFSPAKVEKGFSSVRKLSDVGSQRFQFFCSAQDIRRQLLSDISGLPWESQCRAVHVVRDYLVYCNPSCELLSSENFSNPLVQFLKDALDKDDAEAQKVGTQLLLTFLRASRNEAAALLEDVYTVLASFLETEAAAETIAIMELLSNQESAFPNFTASGALTLIIKFLDSGHNKEFQAAIIRILYNLSLSIDACSCKSVMDWIPILVRFLGDRSVTGTCLSILENLCKFKEARIAIAETEGCIGSIVELLETGSCEDQEYGVGILSSLCNEHEYYFHLAGHEGVVPNLVHVSVNGNENGKIRALDLLCLFRDTRIENDAEQCCRSSSDAFDGSPKNSEKKRFSKISGCLGKKMKNFLRKNCWSFLHFR